jgi:hypothetical protein
MKNLSKTQTHDTLELDTTGLTRLEVEGHFMGWVDIWAGHITLYHRGKWQVCSLAEERKKQKEAQCK